MLRHPNSLVDKKPEIVESIVDAAERLLNSYGYQKMTMTDLAAEAGIGVGTTYLYFGSKADVAVAVADRVHDRMRKSLVEFLGSTGSPVDILAEMLWFRISDPYNFVRRKLETMSWQQLSRHGTQFMDDIRSTDPGLVDQWRQKESSIFAKIIDRGHDEGVFVSVNSEQTAKTMLAAACGFMPKNLDQADFNDPNAFENRVRGVIRLLVNGITVDKYL